MLIVESNKYLVPVVWDEFGNSSILSYWNELDREILLPVNEIKLLNITAFYLQKISMLRTRQINIFLTHKMII